MIAWRHISIIAFVIIVLSGLGFGIGRIFTASYQAGWDAREALALKSREVAVTANTEASQRAAQELSENLDAVQIDVDTLNRNLREIEDESLPAAADVCGLSLDSLQQLEAIR